MIRFLKRLSHVLQKTTTIVFLHLAYVVGIGVTSGIGKVLKRSFFSVHPVKSNWIKHKTDGSIKTMY